MDITALNHNVSILEKTDMGLILVEGLKMNLDQQTLIEIFYGEGGILSTIKKVLDGGEGSIESSEYRDHFARVLNLTL